MKFLYINFLPKWVCNRYLKLKPKLLNQSNIMQPAATIIITRSTNRLARAVGVFVTLTTSHVNQNCTHRSMRRDLCPPDLWKRSLHHPLPKMIFTKQTPVIVLWISLLARTCKLLTYNQCLNMYYYNTRGAVLEYALPADYPQLRTQRPRPFEIDSDYNFPWSSVARAQRPMESSV